MHSWSVGDHLTHRFNPELGTGHVTAIEGRVLVVHFPLAGATLRLAAGNDADLVVLDEQHRAATVVVRGEIHVKERTCIRLGTFE